MTVDEFRRQVIEELRNCSSQGQVYYLLEQVHARLSRAPASATDRVTFWHTLRRDLQVLSEDAPLLPAKAGTSDLIFVIGSALRAIGHYERSVGTEPVKSGPSD